MNGGWSKQRVSRRQIAVLIDGRVMGGGSGWGKEWQSAGCKAQAVNICGRCEMLSRA